MNKIAKALIPALGLISIVQFGCRTLSTTQRIPNTESAINGMLYYLPIGKITIKGEYGNTDSNSAPSPGGKQQVANLVDASPSPTPPTPGQQSASSTPTSRRKPPPASLACRLRRGHSSRA